MYELSQATTGTLWAGFVTMGSFSILFYSRSLKTREEANKVFRIVMMLTTIINTLFYLLMASIASETTEPFAIFDYQVLQYVKWLVTTPILIALVGILEKIPPSQIFVLCSFQALTIICGFIAYSAKTAGLFGTFFGAGVVCYGFTILPLLDRTFKFYSKNKTLYHVNNWVFTVLVLGMTAIWSLYPLGVILTYVNIIDISTELIVFTVLDFFSKGVFGVILIGAKEVEEGIESVLATLSRSVVRIHPVTLAPIQENTEPVNIQIIAPPRSARRGSIYIYTPPVSQNTMSPAGSTNYSAGSQRVLIP